MPKFQRRHYEALAKVFLENKPYPNWDANKRTQHDLLLRDLAAMLQMDNPNFKRDRFVLAAGDYCSSN